MSLANMVRTIKQIHPEDVVLIKIGVFYHAYGKDAYIISYLFGYKRNAFGENSSTCGFPKSALNYVKTVVNCQAKINKNSHMPFGAWGDVFNDNILASAILDRLLDQAYVVKIVGESYRTKYLAVNKKSAG